MHQRLRARRAAGDVHVDRHELVGRHQRVVVEDPHRAAASAHRDRPLRLEHLVIQPPDDRRHLDRHAPGEDDQVGLAGGGAERLEAEARDVHARAGGVELLHRAARQPEPEREERVGARPRHGAVERRRQHAFFDVAFELRALQVGGEVEPVHLAAAQQLRRVQPVDLQAARVGRGAGAGEPCALHLHSNAPLRHTYTNATTSSTMNTAVSLSA